MVHLCASISDDLDALGKVGIAVQAKQGREGLLLGEITRSAEDDDGGVLLELLGSAMALSAAERRAKLTWHCCKGDGARRRLSQQ